MASSEEGTEAKWTPPYIPFRTVLNLIMKMEGEAGIPPQVDRTFLTGAEGDKTKLLVTLRGFGFIDENGKVLRPLVDLVKKPNDRAALLKELLERLYPAAVELGKINATDKQLDQVFEEMETTAGDTRRKAIGFYLRAANFAGIGLSPNFRKPQERKASTRRTRGKRSPDPAANLVGYVQPPPANDKGTDLRTRYIEMLMDLAAKKEGDKEILDRIERALGVSAEDAAAHSDEE